MQAMPRRFVRKGTAMAKLSVAQALLRANGHMRKGELDDARALYASILATYPMNERAQQGLAKLNAVRAQNTPQDAPPQAQLDALIVAYSQQRFTAMVEHAERLVSAYPAAFVVWNLLAAGRKALGQFAEAEKGFRRAAELNPSYADAYINLGVTLQDQGKTDEAISAYRHALSINGTYAEAHNNMGNALKDQGKLAEAVAAYACALEFKPVYAEAHNNLGVAQHMMGALDTAISSFRRALEINPSYFEAYNNMGVMLQEQGKLNDALFSFERALAIRPSYAEAHNNTGNTLKELNRLPDAIAAYQRAVDVRPDYAEAHNNMGIALKDQGQPEAALAAFQRALQIKPTYAEAHCNMGVTLQEQGNSDAAILAYQKAIASNASYAQAHFNMGTILKEQGFFDDALASYRLALEIKPDYAEALNNIGDVLKEQGEREAAIEAFERAIEVNPTYAEAYNNLGVTLQELGEFDAAIAALRCAVDFKPTYAEAYNNMGVTLQEQGNLDEAITAYRQAIALKPDYAEAYCNAGSALSTFGDSADAIELLSKAVEADPTSAKYRLYKLCMTLPIVWDPKTDTDPLAAFDKELSSLADWAATDGTKEMLSEGAGGNQPFHLAYHPENMAERLRHYGDLICEEHPEDKLPPSDSPSKKKPVIGVVSSHLRYHSVFNVITKGLLDNIDTAKFSVIVYDIRKRQTSAEFSASSSQMKVRHFFGPGRKKEIKTQIQKDEVDFLLYPEIGMDPATTWLAAQRLAKVQAVSWGHPITSGLKTIDYFISGDLLESAEAEQHYTEKLVRLPGTGCYTEFSDRTKKPCRFDLGTLPATAPRLIIPQNPFKFHPENDDLIIEIARRCEDAVFLVPASEKFPKSFERIIQRIEARAEETGLSMSLGHRLVVFPWLPAAEFLDLLENVDVFLDLPTFSGYTTAWQAMYCGLPIVTLEGEFMRQRLAAGLLRQAGIPQTIAASAKDYVDIAVDLAERSRNKGAYGAYRSEIRANAPLADRNIQSVRAFESFVQNVLEDQSVSATSL